MWGTCFINKNMYWFWRFKSGDFDISDKAREDRPVQFEDAELEALLNQESCQTQEELAKTLGMTQQAISNRHCHGYGAKTRKLGSV
ncbi:MAG: hypothetical protein PV362_04935 [Providencia heimbachae]|nr:hypothetical protein [Providencia heimbachae]